MLIVALLLYFLPTVVALSRGHLSALAIFFLNLFLGWTLIGWIIAFIWSWTGNTQANFYRLEAGPTGPIPQRRSGSLWLVLILILVGLVLLDKRRDFRGARSISIFPIRPGFDRASRNLRISRLSRSAGAPRSRADRRGTSRHSAPLSWDRA
jgi:uncharacterized membrane protein